MTEESARRFCELAQLDYREAEGVVYLRKRENEWTIPFAGGAGVFLILDEMARRGWEWALVLEAELYWASFATPETVGGQAIAGRYAGKDYCTFERIPRASGSADATTPLEAVLSAANAALEAEGAR